LDQISIFESISVRLSQASPVKIQILTSLNPKIGIQTINILKFTSGQNLNSVLSPSIYDMFPKTLYQTME